MRILALETATRRGSVALWDAGVVHARAGGDDRTHGARLPGEILALLADTGYSLADVDVFAVVSGPGSFTGLRVGIASIQGLALAGARQVIAIPTLEALAEGWRTQNPRTSEPQNPRTPEPQNPRTPEPPTLVVSCVDGQRGEVFFAAWAMTRDTPVEDAREVIRAAVGTPQELRAQLESGQARAGLEHGPVVLVGDGVGRHPEAFAGLAADVCELAETLAGIAVRVASSRLGSAVSPHALRPIYIRRPDAELARERAVRP